MNPLRVNKREFNRLKENLKYPQRSERVLTGSETEELERRIKKLEKQAGEFETWENLICRHYKELEELKQKVEELWKSVQRIGRYGNF